MIDLANEVPEEEVQEEINSASPPQKNQEDDKEKNWKAFLEKRKEDQALLEKEQEKNRLLEESSHKRQKELDEIKILVETLVNKKSHDEPEDEDNETRTKKAIAAEVDRIIEKREKERRDNDEKDRFQKESIEIKNQMPDLLEVCNQENLAYLEYYFPEIAKPLAMMPNSFEKTRLAYQAVKKHVKMATKDKEKIEKNLSKPKSVHSAMSNESQNEESSAVMSDKRKNETWQKMQRLMSGEDEE